jgi:hypothetical protein
MKRGAGFQDLFMPESGTGSERYDMNKDGFQAWRDGRVEAGRACLQAICARY